MQLYKREVIHSLFYEILTEFIEKSLRKYSPRASTFPLPDRDDLEVDFQFDIRPRPIFLFGVKDNTKARLATISCLEFQKKKQCCPGKISLSADKYRSISWLTADTVGNDLK